MEIRTLPIADLHPADYNPRKNLKPGDAEYEKLKEQFHPDKFDADFITDLAREAGMNYVNLTARHHDSFCLFESKHSDYTSANSPAKRDLVGELAAQCRNFHQIYPPVVNNIDRPAKCFYS